MRQRKVVRKVWFTIKLLLSMGGLQETEKKELENGEKKFHEKLCEVDSSTESKDIIDTRRKFLYSNSDMFVIFRLLWQTVVIYTDPSTASLPEDGYIRLDIRVQRALLGENVSEQETLEFAKADYLNDVKSYGALNKVAFMDALSEMIEIWSENTHPRFCAAFSWALLESIADVNVYPPQLRPVKDVKCITSVRENDILARFAETTDKRVALRRTLDWMEKMMIPVETQARLSQRRGGIFLNQPTADMVSILNSTTQFNARGCSDPYIHSIYDSLSLSREYSLDTDHVDMNVISNQSAVSSDGTAETVKRLVGESRRPSITGTLLSLALASRLANKARRKSIGGGNQSSNCDEVQAWVATIIHRYCTPGTGDDSHDSTWSKVENVKTNRWTSSSEEITNDKIPFLGNIETDSDLAMLSPSTSPQHASPSLETNESQVRPHTAPSIKPIQRIDPKVEYKYNLDTTDNSYYDALYNHRHARRVASLYSNRPSSAKTHTQLSRHNKISSPTSNNLQQLHGPCRLGQLETITSSHQNPTSGGSSFVSHEASTSARRRPQTASSIEQFYRRKRNHEANEAMLMRDALQSVSQCHLKSRTSKNKSPSKQWCKRQTKSTNSRVSSKHLMQIRPQTQSRNESREHLQSLVEELNHEELPCGNNEVAVSPNLPATETHMGAEDSRISTPRTELNDNCTFPAHTEVDSPAPLGVEAESSRTSLVGIPNKMTMTPFRDPNESMSCSAVSSDLSQKKSEMTENAIAVRPKKFKQRPATTSGCGREKSISSVPSYMRETKTFRRNTLTSARKSIHRLVIFTDS
mmetsp:Transcript_24582/g.36201  ORF Transcript_24582/g.36201 Transcript_24582/m.36201 type:complete len:810 (+) Transcript_24582:199-2628(+)|eukprot:CAMPEP_0185031714 /NCGR_PEP_ID=MMETSP1103-20130426/19329_1 /TAXON_ID=36769 /ORGANISM="Paraphysomonas bandaiensis, Strain Caron Lab Isolate" /LENGTH=809 /DNA_ID=CAMNT_0027567333 /DNA_START=128 /DNA_END=2557 /DNA_ORIENTATION=+